MRFFFEFVSCYGRSVNLAADPGIGDQEIAEGERPPPRLAEMEESRRQRRRKRGRVGSTGHGLASWKPSLYAISEEKIAATEDGAEKSILELKLERVVKRKSCGGLRSKVHLRSYHDDYRRNSVETIIPVFSAAPFMF